jgi:hypothetical protein
MSDPIYISSAYPPGASDHDYIVEEESTSLANFIQNEFNVTTDSHNFGEFELPDKHRTEEEFGEDSVDYLEENNKINSHDEIVIVGHSNETWGYGLSSWAAWNDNYSKKLHTVLVYIGSFISDYEKRLMCWHEPAHVWGNDHEDGNWDYDGYTVDNITPIACSYVRNDNNIADLSWSGGDPIPTSDCDGTSNYVGVYPSATHSDYHQFPYSDCVRGRLKDFYEPNYDI